MDKTQRQTKNTTWLLVVCILAVLSIIGCLMVVKIYKDSKTYARQNIFLQEKIDSLSNEVNTKDQEVNTLQTKLDSINNIDNSISSVKEEYFKYATEAESLAKSGEANFKVCYLTFDDGPYRKTTPTFLDILDEKDVLATFFLLEKEGVDDLYFREMYSCHTLANHTASHAISGYTYSSEANFINDIKENHEFIQNLLGYTMEVMRFPGGSPQATYSGLSKSAIVSELVDMHYGYVDWTLTTGDGGAVLEPDEFLHNVIDYSSKFNTLIVLMHDYSANTAKCLPEMIDELSNQGFIFLPLSYNATAVKKQ